jgi:putative phosphoribosyl transferase
MYFASRLQAGRMLASQLVPKYRYENCAVIALSDGGAMVGVQIASELHCVLNMLLTAEIMLPREPNAIAGITSQGNVAFNPLYSKGEVDDMMGDYFSFVEQEKFNKMHDMNRMLGTGGLIDKKMLRGHIIILVSDGLKSGFALDLALEFLKPIDYEKLIIATPFASVQAVDRMHIMADEILCMNVLENYISTDHYYDTNDIPDHEVVIKTIEDIVLHWK